MVKCGIKHSTSADSLFCYALDMPSESEFAPDITPRYLDCLDQFTV